MKKIIPVLLMLSLLLASCARPQSKQPVIVTSFVTNAQVEFNDMKFSCTIERTETSQINVKIIAPEDLAGLSFSCEGEVVTQKLDDLTYSVSPDEIPATSFIMTLSSVFNAMIRINEISVNAKNETYEYEGSCKQGSFVLLQNTDYSYKNLEVNENLQMEFSDFTTK